MTIYKITGLEYNRILFGAGMNEETMALHARIYIVKKYQDDGVTDDMIRNVIVDKMDGVIAVTVDDETND